MKKTFFLFICMAFLVQAFGSSFDLPPQKSAFNKESTSKILEEYLMENEEGSSEMIKPSRQRRNSEKVFFDVQAAKRFSKTSSDSLSPDHVYHKPATPKKVWIFAREDSNKNFVEGHYLYFSLDDACWIYQKPEQAEGTIFYGSEENQ